MANLGQSDFNARIKRIKNPLNKSYYDPELNMDVPKHTSHETIRKDAKRRKMSFGKITVSLLIGALAMVIAQALRVRYLGLSDVSHMTLVTDLLLGAFFLLLMSAMMRHRKFLLRASQMIGAAAMLVAGHNLMWAYPQELAVIYSTEYVQTVRARTAPMSLQLHDTTIGL
ncbi:hypothetical protein [Yoonia sp. 2307UL14-13]|uniref:hypothetical protein n=1 Tax=Yoonia sp. 2307UL14-13 TaxID=3126506 RepID=UPI0030B3785E